MEIVDNAVLLLVPGAMDAGLTSALFWGALAVALAIAFAAAYPLNRRLLTRQGPSGSPRAPRLRSFVDGLGRRAPGMLVDDA
jgi:hypothetical protein